MNIIRKLLLIPFLLASFNGFAAGDFLNDYSTTAGSNTVVGDVNIDEGMAPSDVNNAIREVMSHLSAFKDQFEVGADVASAAAANVDVTGIAHDITGTTTITSLANPTNDTSHIKVLQFNGALTLTHSANLILPGAANITTTAGDVGIFMYEGASVWRLVSYSGVYNNFTSVGIDDNATSEMLEINDGSLRVGDASSGETAQISLNTTSDGQLRIGGGANANSGGNVIFYGDTHATLAGDVVFRDDATTTLTYDKSGTIWDFQSNVVTIGGAFTSLGIDDNATKEMVQIADDTITIGGGDAAETSNIIQAVDDGLLIISGGNAATSGANLELFGDTHATQAEDVVFRDGATTTLQYDKSATLWDFQSNDITVDGDLGFGAAPVGVAQMLISKAFTSDGSSTTASIIRSIGSLTGASGDTSHLSAHYFSTDITTQAIAETIGSVAQLRIDEPTITNSTATITNAATVHITGAPTEGSSNYAMLIDSGDVKLAGTGSLINPVGTTAQRVAEQGAIRYNTTTGNFEGYDGTGWDDLGAAGITVGTAQASTSGTTIDFTSLPAGITTLTIILSGVSTSGTDDYIIQIGDSGGLETTGYAASSVMAGNASASTGLTETTGIPIVSTSAANVMHAQITFRNIDSNTWVGSGSIGISNSGFSGSSSGSKTLTGTLDRITLTTQSGTDTFDAGTVNIFYQ